MDTQKNKFYHSPYFSITQTACTNDFPQSKGHLHKHYEIYFFLEGDVTYFIEGSYYKLEPYDILIINDREIHNPIFNSHSYYERIVTNIYTNTNPYFYYNNYDFLYCFKHRNLGKNNLIPRNVVKDKNLYSYFEKIFNYSHDQSLEAKAMIDTTLMQLLIELNDIYKKNVESFNYTLNTTYSKIQSIVNYINNHLETKITLQSLQDHFYISKYHLCHIFKESTGFTVQEYVMQKKIILAKELLFSGKTASQTSLELGFNDYSSFYRIFKEYVKMTPLQYIQKYKKI